MKNIAVKETDYEGTQNTSRAKYTRLLGRAGSDGPLCSVMVTRRVVIFSYLGHKVLACCATLGYVRQLPLSLTTD